MRYLWIILRFISLSNLGLNIEFYCTVVEPHWGKQSKNFWHSSLENILHVSKYGCVQHMMKKNHTQTTLHWLHILHINMRLFFSLRCVLVSPHGTTMGRLLHLSRGTYKKGHSVFLKERSMACNHHCLKQDNTKPNRRKKSSP